MTVGVQGHRYVRVAEQLHHGSRVHTLQQQQSGSSVSEIVNSDFG